jgi:cell fate regulator YaaT (PSP1 superfamily)
MTAGASHAKTGPSRLVYNVKFKRSQRNFVLSPRITRDVKIGCYVKVEADRGEDLGIVMGVIPVEKFLASNHRHRSMTEDSISSGDSPSQAANLGDMKRIMRAATNDEITLLEVKREEEEELLKICSTKVRQRGLPMTVVDAEYQFDRNKLTFFFQAEGRIDFRELVRDLFSMYKTRIWMQQLNKDGVVEEGDGNAFQ